MRRKVLSFFWVVGYQASRKAREGNGSPTPSRRRDAGSYRLLWFRSHKILLRAQSPFQLTRHVVRDISWMLTVAPIGSLDSLYLTLAYYSLNFKLQPSFVKQVVSRSIRCPRIYPDTNNTWIACLRLWETKSNAFHVRLIHRTNLNVSIILQRLNVFSINVGDLKNVEFIKPLLFVCIFGQVDICMVQI